MLPSAAKHIAIPVPPAKADLALMPRWAAVKG
jgi:hypothetical protein